MALDKHAELLGSVSLFSGLTQEQLVGIVAKGKKVFFEVGATIVKRLAKGNCAYLILSGVAVTRPPKGTRMEPERLEAGTLVGEMVMLTDTTYGLDIVAEERVRALCIDRAELYAIMDADPSIAHIIREKLTERLIFIARDLREADARFAMLEASLDDVIASVA
jgi:CRP-like cAMP-binding protein